jgi:hypothetical protein
MRLAVRTEGHAALVEDDFYFVRAELYHQIVPVVEFRRPDKQINFIDALF